MNKVTIIGHLGNEPEMSTTPNGSPVCRFSVATNRRFTRSDGVKVDETEWFRCSAFGKNGERCLAVLRKGRQVYVEGRLTGHAYVTRDGEATYNLNVAVTEFSALGPRPEGLVGDQYYAGGEDLIQPNVNDVSEEDAPF